ncbi:FAD-dependent oxidoreductase [bacterium (Candidatus Blackallbacteria) CG17_big_fil_post_rev_8_21_14_2_50_48_46]|uniref:FAD-dependent oxidoreductase n=1 Tax=bacterium (Candidatus Blackallbacteria) CG17_big_fil_post_rev_8_21_14_2_50_48_46 TaxID=2014261 RepID=A0A2M7G2W9_9BACT|nr:MAG: FAD-dependent oxidoreductase [bacterium (Candidatus Blackallbacteria) CG18_big_fil_WC_8_21_14_2_50_49_26]PIW16152.1 MAG: FAD-dependent oxidoreductase [bacterium (Candidatus Blackallbacteria) CG17_big_fil_post_rev_8_21_14_2_50_48_46]PIW44239.1 MAG: FAD-dependent oxidoreductase [bacterium (Candidatus Blackallbacteria) CG13_big_fil_rev_8_21_14_2_50_49_14]
MKVLIAGAGIGGLGMALALEKFGIEAEIFEAAPVLKAVGAGLWVAPNGLEILNRISPELKRKVQEAGQELAFSSVEDLQGHQLSGFNAAHLRSRYGAGPLAIKRADLHQILIQALRKTTLQTGKRLQSFITDEDQIVLEFEDGSQTRGDLLIGADGLRSRVRQSLFGDIPLRYSGQTCWRGLAPLQLPAPWQGKGMELWGDKPGLRAGFSPVSAQEVYFYLTQALPAGGKDSPETLKSELLKAFAAFPPLISELIQATPHEAFLRNDLSDFVPLNHYGKDRVFLLGDAAHATTPNLGQGANQALESAWVLAESLAQNPEDLHKVLQRYESLRIPRARRIVETSWKIGQLSNLKRGLRLRNWFMSHLPASLTEKQLQAVFQIPAS